MKLKDQVVIVTGAGRLGTAEDQARAALFLVSDDSDFVYGANLIVDGGVMATADFPTETERKR